MKIVVNTPAGHVGRAVVERLLASRHTPVIISRHTAKVADLAERGAKIVKGSMDDPVVLDRAFKGADAVFWLTPITFDQLQYVQWVHRTGEIAAECAKQHGVKRAVVLSTVGAQENSKSGLLECLWVVEQAFKKAVPNVTALRPGAFMENFLNNVTSMAEASCIFGRYPTTKRIPMVATCDVAALAEEILLDGDWRGFRVLELHGPEDLNQSRAAEIISEALSRTVTYVEVTDAQAKQGMLAAGMPPDLVELMLGMYTELNAGRMEPEQPRSESTTTKTTLKQFAREVLKPAVESGVPAR